MLVEARGPVRGRLHENALAPTISAAPIARMAASLSSCAPTCMVW